MILYVKGADFSSANIGTLNTFAVRKSIGIGATYNIPDSVTKNTSVTWTITLADGYTFGNYSVTMGTTTITPSVSDNVMTITIDSVTANIAINVATVNDSTGDEDPGVGGGSGELTPYQIFTGVFIGSDGTYSSEASSKVHAYKVIPGETYTIASEMDETNLSSNRNVIFCPVTTISNVAATNTPAFCSGYSERIVVKPENEDDRGCSTEFVAPSDCNYIVVSNYQGTAILTVIGVPGDSGESGTTVEVTQWVSGVYISAQSVYSAAADANSQLFKVEPNSSYRATCINPDKQVVCVQIKSANNITAGNTPDFATGHDARIVGDKNVPLEITTASDCEYLFFSGYKGTDGKYQNVTLIKL